MPNIQELEALTIQVRRDILRMVHKVNSGHPGGSLGCAEFFVSLYNEIMETNDGRIIDIERYDLPEMSRNLWTTSFAEFSGETRSLKRKDMPSVVIPRSPAATF